MLVSDGPVGTVQHLKILVRSASQYVPSSNKWIHCFLFMYNDVLCVFNYMRFFWLYHVNVKRHYVYEQAEPGMVNGSVCPLPSEVSNGCSCLLFICSIMQHSISQAKFDLGWFALLHVYSRRVQAGPGISPSQKHGLRRWEKVDKTTSTSHIRRRHSKDDVTLIVSNTSPIIAHTCLQQLFGTPASTTLNLIIYIYIIN